MLSRLEASEAQRQVSLMLATNDRSLADEDVTKFRQTLAKAASDGERLEPEGRRIGLAEATSVINLAPPDEKTLKMIAERQKEKSG